MTNETEAEFSSRKTLYAQILIGLVLLTALVYFFSSPDPSNHYDYTFRVAENFLRGNIGFTEKPPRWLNEFVPYDNRWYSVFPLGSVLTMIPFAFLKLVGIVKEMPAALIYTFAAVVICVFLIKISDKYEHDFSKKIWLILSILFGTWMWTNLTYGGAWQLALGFAMIGELGAIYFTVYERKPLLAGFFFALAFGNRTENLLTAPVFMWLIYRLQIPNSRFQIPDSEFRILESESVNKQVRLKKQSKKTKKNGAKTADSITKMNDPEFGIWNLESGIWKDLAKFCIFPFILGVSTLVYNYVRFDSLTDFGYARIPGVLEEPWYYDGIFSLKYIPGQAWEMLFRLWERKAEFPYLVPNGFSSSILLSSPFVLLIFRRKSLNKSLKYAAWSAIVILTFLLWIHGNSGGWQFGYRYAMILLPWFFVLLLENSPKKITITEAVLIGFSILMNLYATYLFQWTEYVKP